MKILVGIFIVCIISYANTHTTHDDLKTAHIRQPQTKQERVYTGNLQMHASFQYAKLNQPKKILVMPNNNTIVKSCCVITSVILHPQPKKDPICS
ncbi:hypothetical protein KBD08_02375 [Candidatus Babeliales bacterium]|nr:hypothetical protein [Candidatus Babeliales bacterium]